MRREDWLARLNEIEIELAELKSYPRVDRVERLRIARDEINEAMRFAKRKGAR